MPHLNDIVVVDTGPLIALSGIKLLQIPSQLFDNVWVSEAVVRESLHSFNLPGALDIASALKKKWFREKVGFDYPDSPPMLGAGEWSAICLADHAKAYLLVDDKVARRVAQSMGVAVLGTCGLLLLAKQRKLIKRVKPLLGLMRGQGYYISNELVKQVVTLAGEK